MKRKSIEHPPFGRVVVAMVRLAMKTSPVAYLLFLGTSLAFTALLVVDLHLIRVLLDDLPLVAGGAIAPGPVVVTIALLGAVGVINSLMNASMNMLYEYVSTKTTGRMTETMAAKASRLDLIRFESTDLYDGIEKAHEGRGRGFDAMEAIVFSAIFHGGYFVFIGAYLVAIEPWLVVGVFAAFLPVALSRAIRATAFYRTENAAAPLRREFAHYEACLTDRSFFKETRTTGAAPFFRALYDRTLRAYNRELWRTELRTGAIDLGLKALTLTGYVGLLLLLARFVIGGSISPGLFGAVYFAMDSVFKWFDELFDRVGSAYENAAFGANYLAFLDTPEREPRHGRSAGPAPVAVELTGVSFGYPGRTERAVDDVTLSIRDGETVAVVGENGAGKSTLVRLIAGLYEPDTGTVTSNRGVVSAVFQNHQRYPMTLRDNIRISEAESEAEPSDDRIVDALEHAGVGRWGDDRTEWLDTVLSREFGGTDLSGGEWQRVAIARAHYRRHDTIVLDEPTSAIDPIEESRVYRSFVESAQGKTAILVTHRLGLARVADRIIVMAHGRIAEDGTHDELMRSDGLYATMYRAQASWYDPD